MKIFGVRKIFYIPPLLILLFGYFIALTSPNVEVQHIYKVLPVFTIYTEQTLTDDQEATCRGLLIIIRPESRDEPNVLKHELVHARQAYKSFFFSWVFAAIDEEILAKMECEAYASHIKADAIPYYAKMIQKEYAPNVPYKIIKNYLTYYVKQQSL